MSRRNKNRDIPAGKPANWMTGPTQKLMLDDWIRVYVECTGRRGWHADEPRRFGWLMIDPHGHVVSWNLRPSRKVVMVDDDGVPTRRPIIFRCHCGIDEPIDARELGRIALELSAQKFDVVDVARARFYRSLLT